MKYLTKDELGKIADRLLENPTREELKKISDEYNNETVKEAVEQPIEETKDELTKVDNTKINSTIENVENFSGIHIPPAEELKPEIAKSEVVSSTIPTPSEEKNDDNKVSQQIPSLEIPKYIVPDEGEKKVSNLNSSPLNFNGNIFEQPNNMMETTDNFNGNEKFNLFEQPTNIEVNKPSFTSGPSMFGQIQNGQ